MTGLASDRRDISTMKLASRSCAVVALWLTVSIHAFESRAEGPLHEQIDRLVESAYVGEPAPLADDGEFVRRVYLDLAGRIPSLEEAGAFLADASADKRVRLVDQLLAGPDFIRHMTITFDVMLMERRPDKHVPSAEWRQYLYESIAANKPLNQLAREILSSDGTDPAMRPAAKFYLDRDAEPNLLTRDVGRMFFGMDLQCAQCHDHPLIESYYQSDYYGIFAYLNRIVLFTDAKDKNKAYLGEKAEGDAKYTSVFTKVEGSSLPHLPTGRFVEDPVFAKDDAYLVAPAKDVRPVPKYSRRLKLAEEATRGDNLAFNRNLANRLWSIMMGRGLVDPVDLHHADNPPTHAVLLDYLAAELAAGGFDLRAFLREIALTRTYQRSLQVPSWPREIELAKGLEAKLEAELAALTTERATAAENAKQLAEQLAQSRAALAPQRDALRQAEQTLADAEKASRDAAAAFAATRASLETQRTTMSSVDAALEASKKAAALLPGEAELTTAVAKFQASRDKLAAEVAKLEGMLPEQQKAAEAAAQAAEQARPPFEAAQQAYHAAAMPLVEQHTQVDAAERVVRDLDNRAAVLRRRLQDASQLAHVKTLYDALDAARASLADSQAQLANARQEADSQRARANQLQADLAAARQAHTELLAATESSRQRLANLEGATTLVAAAIRHLEEARSALPDDEELRTAAEDLGTRAVHLTEEKALAASTVRQQQTACDQSQSRLAALEQATTSTAAKLAELDKQLSTLAERCHAAEQTCHAAEAALSEPLAELENAWVAQLGLAPLKALTPEQLARSMLEATGVAARHRKAAADELRKKPDAPQDPAVFDREVEKAVHAKLEGSINEFVRLFGAGAGQPQHTFFATVDQALYFDNGGTLRSWLAPSGDNLTGRLLKHEDAHELANELYLSVLTRLPNEQEVELVRRALAADPAQKNAIVQELAWALLTSAEFRFAP